MLGRTAASNGSTPGPSVTFAKPPRVSQLYMPEHLASGGLSDPDHEGDVHRFPSRQVCATSQDGLLLLSCEVQRISIPALVIGKPCLDGLPDMMHLVFNPITGEISPCLPDIKGPRREILCNFNLGILTPADGRRSRSGPPDRYAVARLELEEHMMLRFLSETRDWGIVSRKVLVGFQEAVAWGGRLWWVDVTWGAISADPFSNRPEPRFVELPSGSVLPEDAYDKAIQQEDMLPDGEGGTSWWMPLPVNYRRVGVTGATLRYVEVSQEEPFVLSSFAIDADGSGWTLEHRVALSRLWVDGGHPWLPALQAKRTPLIGALRPFKANVVHLTVGNHVVIVDMDKGQVTGHCPRRDINPILQCVLPPWLSTTSISSLG
ncbi:hypothetical protein BRADI_4g13406v3 [Brachypodium distachyon]|uniref:DUF1618 domain-containing protein n=1 Tax=Brachypodium distachyon TaxID=15368 RepID=A0A0Q3HH69_BRADI|nr:hypothetical protein BRADI_4g13406v3 [Brachypodium distachyon]